MEVEVDTSHLVEVLLTEQTTLLVVTKREVLLTEQTTLLVVTMAVVVVVDLLVIPYMEKML